MVTDNDLAIIAESMPVIRTLPEPLQMFFELFFDTTHCVAASDRPDATQIHRRNYIRGIFAFIEGTTYIFKQYALSQSASKPGFYTEGELSFLRDEARDPHDKKPTPGRVKFARTDDNFKYGVNLLMRIWVPDYLIDTGGSGWQSFLKSLELRHRITHPKTLQPVLFIAPWRGLADSRTAISLPDRRVGPLTPDRSAAVFAFRRPRDRAAS